MKSVSGYSLNRCFFCGVICRNCYWGWGMLIIYVIVVRYNKMVFY